MRLKNIYWTNLFLLTPFLISAAPIDRILVDSGIIGNFTNEDTVTKLFFNVKWNKTFDSIVDVIRLYKGDTITQVIQKNGQNTEPNMTYTVMFEVDLSSYVQLKDFKIEYLIRSTLKNSALVSFVMPFNKKSSQTYNALDYEDYVITNSNRAFYIEKSVLKPLEEKYSFIGWSDYFKTNRYFKLDLSELKFGYSYISPFVYEDAYMTFFDDNYCFPYLTRTGHNLISIPLKIEQIDDYCQINYAKPFYVDRNTLQLSDTYREDFELTNSFFLPKNKASNVNRIEFCFQVNNSGAYQTSFTWQMGLLTNLSLVGECSNSEYCVVGGVK